METVEKGDKVQLLCELKLEDGTTCFKNEKDKPFNVTVGDGKFFPSIENKITNMKKGETKKVTLEPKDAFGVHNDDLVTEIPIKNITDSSKLKIGSKIQVKSSSDKMIEGTITDIKNDKCTVDFNHPLAGKNVVFIFTIESIQKN